MSYFDYLNRLAPLVEFLRLIGVWAFPHPWVNLFVAAANAETLIGETLATLTIDDVGQGPILIYPFNRELFHTPFFRVPETDHFFVFALLRNAVPPTPGRAAELIAANRTLFERATMLGGKRYPFDSVPMTRHDWQTLSTVMGSFRECEATFRSRRGHDAGTGHLLALCDDSCAESLLETLRAPVHNYVVIPLE